MQAVNKQPFPKDFLVNYLMSNTEIACCLFNKKIQSLCCGKLDLVTNVKDLNNKDYLS